ncbi:MAG: CofH family radical SAM protein [Candidatus Omnitrophica bacterium]|nr:CofH family radical SAM protein [Candidatus Omnitrophota bacterium]
MSLETALQAVLDGGELGNDTALEILGLSGEDLALVYQTANELNLRLNQSRVSFIHNMNMNYTNICEYFCSFCEFGKSRYAKDTYILSEEDVWNRIGKETISEITFQGGLSDVVKFEDVLKLLRAIKQRRPEIHMHAFSPEEIHFYARKNGMSYRDTILECRAAGMDSMCGTAAEILDDEVRRKICPTKITTDQWLEIIGTAHEMGIRSTATILFGHVEEPVHVVNHLGHVRTLQKQTGGFTEFILLLFMPDKTRLGRRTPAMNRIEYAYKMIALARLYFSNTIRNVQTSWVKLGFDSALGSLEVGANDMGGTLYFENITREAGGRNGEYTSLDTFHSAILGRGKTPVQRDTLYSFQSQLQFSLSV